MADRWAEVREIEGQIVAKIIEHDHGLLLPWRTRRRRQIRRELEELLAELRDAIAKAGKRPGATAYEGGMNPYMRRKFPA